MSLLAAAGSLAGCHKENATKAEVGANADPVKKSLEELTPELAAQNEKFSALGKQVEALPQDLHGVADLRAKYYATEEGRGIMGVKLTWLAGRLDAALKSGKREELEQVSKDIAKTHDEMRQIEQLHVELLHQVLAHQRVAARMAKEGAPATSLLRILPTNFEVKAFGHGIEQRLLEVIEDSKRKPDKTSWFDFDRLFFSNDGVELDRDLSKSQLDNVFEILKAYPAVTLKLSGYVDSTGDAAANKKFAADRADAVKNELVRLGVSASRLDTKGRGADHPSCSVDTEACRKANRRVAAQITTK